MATHDKFIVAVELGSSKVSAVAGEKQPDGAVRILAFAQEPSEDFIRKGRINNIDKFNHCLSNLKKKIESGVSGVSGVSMSVAKAYVGIGGMGMHSVMTSVTKTYPESVKVTEQMVDIIRDENNSHQPADRDVIDVVPQEYKLGLQKTNEPVGILTQSVTGNFLNIVVTAQTKQQIIKYFAESDIEVVELPVAFLALADNMVSDRQKQSGCIFVDMGAQTTSVAIYKGGLLRHLAVIPLGGANITTDIATFCQIDEAEAEDIKLNYNFAIEDIDEEDKEQFTVSDGRVFLVNDLKKLVSARLEEIILNVKYQIELSQLTLPQFLGGIVLTGGVTRTRGIERAYSSVTGIPSSVSVSRGLKLQYRTTGKQDFNKDGSFDCVIALVEKGNENCCGGPIGQPNNLFGEEKKPTPQPTSEPQEEKSSKNDGRITDPTTGEPSDPAPTTEPAKKKPSVFGNLGKKAKTFLNNLVSPDMP